MDAELVRRGLAANRARAQAEVVGGRILVAGAPASKVSRLVAPNESISVLGPPAPFVSRGGHKLEAALDRFNIDVSGRHALDAGASTGGFTDCLLQRGAAKVVALDVGHGQLHQRLRGDPRVMVVERTNLRHVHLDQIGGSAFGVLVADLSFISLTAVAPVLAAYLAAPGADLAVLAKPQFEAGRTEASRGKGVIRDPVIWRRVLDQVGTAFQGAGAVIMGAMVSPITGAQGNVEFFLHMRAATTQPLTEPNLATGPFDLDGLVSEAAGQAKD